MHNYMLLSTRKVNALLTLLLFIVLLSIIIIVHEFGHLIAAKAFNIYCHEFAIGMGPKIYSKKFKETTYSLRAIPMGGFVSMAGDSDNALESEVDVEVPFERTLGGLKKWKKIIVMLAGIFMNIILAIFILAMVLLYNGSYPVSQSAIISTVTENSPAYNAGLMPGDEIERISFSNGISNNPSTFDDMVAFLYSYDGDGDVTFTVTRDGKQMDIAVKPIYDESSSRYIVGIGSGQIQYAEVNIFNCWYYAIDYCMYVMRTIFMSLSQLIRGYGLQNLSGPVGIYQATDEAVSMGAQSYFIMMAVISLNVGIFNALPIPIMDGGRVLLTIVEAIIGHPISEKMESVLMSASMLLLLFIVVIATFQDIIRIF